MAIRKISRSMFDRAIKSLSLNPQQISRAKRVLLGGETIKQVAASEGLTYESVRCVVASVLSQVDLPNPRYSHEQLDFAFSRMPRLSERSRSMIRRVLVDGEAIGDVAIDEGITKVTLIQKITKVKQVILPEGWRFVSGALPNDEADIVDDMFKNAQARFLDD